MPRRAFAINDYVHRVAAGDYPFQCRLGRNSACNVLLVAFATRWVDGMEVCEATGREIMPPEFHVHGVRTIRQGNWFCFGFAVEVPLKPSAERGDAMSLCAFGRFSDDGMTLLEWTTEDPCGFISDPETQASVLLEQT